MQLSVESLRRPSQYLHLRHLAVMPWFQWILGASHIPHKGACNPPWWALLQACMSLLFWGENHFVHLVKSQAILSSALAGPLGAEHLFWRDLSCTESVTCKIPLLVSSELQRSCLRQFLSSRGLMSRVCDLLSYDAGDHGVKTVVRRGHWRRMEDLGDYYFK